MIRVDKTKWEAWKRANKDAQRSVLSVLPYASIAADACVAGFRATRIQSTDLDKIGQDMLTQAKARCPVDTGALRDSLEVDSD